MGADGEDAPGGTIPGHRKRHLRFLSGQFGCRSEKVAISTHLLECASELSTGTLKVGAGGRCHIMKMLAAFRRRYPGVHVSISISNSEQNLKSLRDYEVDIATFSDLQPDITHLDSGSRLFTR